MEAPTALDTATTEELVQELAKRSNVLVIGMVAHTPESGSSGCFDTIYDFKESAPFQVAGFIQDVAERAENWHLSALRGDETAIEEDEF